MFAAGFLRTVKRALPFPVVNFAIVAGGGGGGRGNTGSGSGGGGGGGGVLISQFQVSLSTPYSATVGVGGLVSGTPILAGSSSIFGFTVTGGGNGGDNNLIGSNGGCGGGGGLGATGGSNRAGGTGVAPYGFNGASSRGTIFNPNPSLSTRSGGGGGAGGNAPDPINSPYINDGGSGISVFIENTLYATFGGGGGGGAGSGTGGAGGTGGGGAGGGYASGIIAPINGIANTGGGGGGQGGGLFNSVPTAASGGTGVVLIWYAGASRGTIQSGTGTTTTFNSNTVHTLTSNAQIIFA